MYPNIHIIPTFAGALFWMAHFVWVTAYGLKYIGTAVMPKLIQLVFYRTHPGVFHALHHGKECIKAGIRWMCVKNQIGVGGHG